MPRVASILFAFAVVFGAADAGFAAGAMRLGPFPHGYDVGTVPLKLSTQIDVRNVKVDDTVSVEVKTVTDLSDAARKIARIVDGLADRAARTYNDDRVSFELALSKVEVVTAGGAASVRAVGSVIEPKLWVGLPGFVTRYLSDDETGAAKTSGAQDSRPVIKAAFQLEVPLDFRLRDDGSVDFIVGRPAVTMNKNIDRLAGWYKNATGTDLKNFIENKFADKISKPTNFAVPALAKYKVSLAGKKFYTTKKILYLEMTLSATAGSADINPLVLAVLNPPPQPAAATTASAAAPRKKPPVTVTLQNAGEMRPPPRVQSAVTSSR